MATKKANNVIVPPIDERETFVSLSKNISDSDGATMELKLRTLYQIQLTDTKIDKIHLLRGELPLEVQDLEDDIAGLKTRVSNLQLEIKDIEKNLGDYKLKIEECKKSGIKYEEQRNNVKNNREYDSLSKEIEYQSLEQEATEKKIRESTIDIGEKKSFLEEAKGLLEGREIDLVNKKKELESIIEETSREEEILLKHKEDLSSKIDERMFAAYNKVRSNAKNKLAVVTVKRDACGGCFNKIPPQRQLDIALSKKIIVCEYCGRILVNSEFEES
ncbi:MAG: C4-type zinc ribbon domain-containing protein [Bacteroidales bacterium]